MKKYVEEDSRMEGCCRLWTFQLFTVRGIERMRKMNTAMTKREIVSVHTDFFCYLNECFDPSQLVVHTL